MNEFMKTYRLKITTLTPVHIGASSDLEPTEYVIYSENNVASPQKNEDADNVICPECGYRNSPKEDICGDCGCPLPKRTVLIKKEAEPVKGKSFLYTFTPAQLSQALSSADKAQLLKVAKNGTTAELKNFFKGKASAISKFATKRAIVSPSIEKKYQEEKTENRLFIEKQISDSVTGLPYIPGSSLKGAIRTALMSKRNKQNPLDKTLSKKGSDAERILYNYKDPTTDPFKALKLQDCRASASFFTRINTTENVKKDKDKATGQGVYTYMECIPPETSFEGTISLIKHTGHPSFDETIETIRDACNDFYYKALDKNEANLKNTHKIASSLFEKARKLIEKPNSFLISLGKHGGAESKTIEGLRQIKIMQGKWKPNRTQASSTTYWFANDETERLPFGWCVVEYEEVK